MNEISVDQLMAIIGNKEVEIIMLRMRVAALEKEKEQDSSNVVPISKE